MIEKIFPWIAIYLLMMIYQKLSGGSLIDLWPLGVLAGAIAAYQLYQIIRTLFTKQKSGH
ncbi:hypothetical protein AGRHK599_LOCUS1295 [Rhizobium rhizogenes]|uniref:Uncharacterized protein n=1 Tax=Rhizobium rhizogenes TaxID=359 RepID=A0AAN2DCM8_RHIRH|nr:MULTISPECIES: hypothetical protein [Rhizobium/Agrobacterium group]AQS61708.1 hypothetical protein B0909_05185 [Rhizobium rhizogenes]MCZ7443070.1 hypothetical protein [Rhizobium rhizogenes]NSZ79056.1 hypothetical protein [Agrobacterium tumefaciens]OAM65846.1 hypothetical protein A8L48_22935 [Rhizobium rhizogenes]CAD0211271.1 hypothetical protein AGRHK599_LOCUS1295 [Rhizobium rhizogenes]